MNTSGGYIMDFDDNNMENNDSNKEIGGQLTELIEMSKKVLKMGDSISVDALLHSLKDSHKEKELSDMKKQINYLTTEYEKLKKQLNKDAIQ